MILSPAKGLREKQTSFFPRYNASSIYDKKLGSLPYSRLKNPLKVQRIMIVFLGLDDIQLQRKLRVKRTVYF